MRAVILAAGQGTRLKKYTENLPKGMLKFKGKTIIERQLEIYRECGITDITVVKGYAADKIKYDGVRYYTNAEYAETNMVESLMAAKPEFQDDLIVSYSDILFESRLLEEMIRVKDDFAVAVDSEWREYWKARYGRIDYDTESLSVDGNGNIIELGLENPKLEEIDARYIGLLKFSKEGIHRISDIWERDYERYKEKAWKQSGKTIRKAYMTDLIQAVIEEGYTVKAVPFRHGWIEFDTNEDYETVCEWSESGRIDQFISLKEV